MRILALVALVAIGCKGKDDTDGVDTDVVVDSDVDSDVHTDVDSDVDTDVDSDTDTGDTDEPGPRWDPADFAVVWDVGPGQTYADPGEVPWESIAADTLVRIHWRDTPYAAKWAIDAVGTETEPIVVVGVPSDSGALPVIDGADAITRLDLDFWSEDRAIVKIGGTSTGADVVPAWVYVEGLEIRGARSPAAFTDDSGAAQTYAANAAAVWIEEGQHITVHGCTLADSGNGLFVSNASSDIVVAQNHVYGNGNPDSIYEHNSYTEAAGITFEYNHYGPLCEGCLGNNLKDRSAGTVIRYNWIEGGNRQLDLVESDSAAIRGRADYKVTFVYGNVLVEPDGAGNSQIVHYGGDGGFLTAYRHGTIYLYHNTIVSTRPGNTTLLRLSTDLETAIVRNNIVSTDGPLAIVADSGYAWLRGNWLPEGWVDAFGSTSGQVVDEGGVVGTDVLFVDRAGQGFTLQLASPAIDQSRTLPAETAAHPVDRQYVVHQEGEPRPVDARPDIGAFER